MPEWLRKLGLAWRGITGARTLGLALGGGGVRGLAHIGVLTVLDREGFLERLRRVIDVERFLIDTMWGC